MIGHLGTARQRAPRRPAVRRPRRSGPGSTSTPATSAATLVEREGWVKTRLAGLQYGGSAAPAHLKGSLLVRGLAPGWPPRRRASLVPAAQATPRHLGLVGIGGGAVGRRRDGRAGPRCRARQRARRHRPARRRAVRHQPGQRRSPSDRRPRRSAPARSSRRAPSGRSRAHLVVHSRRRAATAPRAARDPADPVESQDRVSDDQPSAATTPRRCRLRGPSRLPAAEPRAAAPVAPPGPAPASHPLRHPAPTGRPYPPPGPPSRAGVAAAPATRRPARPASPAGSGRSCAVLALVVGVVGGVRRRRGLRDLAPQRVGRGGTVGGGLAGVGARLAGAAPGRATARSRPWPSSCCRARSRSSAQYQGKKDGATGSGFVLDRSGPLHHQQPRGRRRGRATTARSRSSTRTATRYDATVVGRSPTYDLAVLYVEDGPRAAAGRPRRVAGAAASATRSSPSARRSGSARRSPPASSARSTGRSPPATPANDVVLHQRRADRRRDQPRQLRRPAGQPARPGRRRQLRHRHHRRQRGGRGRQHRRRLRDPDRAGQDHRRPDPAHRRGALPGDRRQGAHRRAPTAPAPRSSRCRRTARPTTPACEKGDVVTARRGREGHRRDRADRGDPGPPARRDACDFTVAARRRRAAPSGSRSARRSADRASAVSRPVGRRPRRTGASST